MTTATIEAVPGLQEVVNQIEGIAEAQPASTPPACGEWIGVGEQEYHACHSHLSNSMLGDFIKSIPLYYQRYVAHTLPPREQTPALVRGAALHQIVLEGRDAFDRMYAIAPRCDKRTNAGKAEWADFCAANADKTVIDAATGEAILGMAQGINENPTALALLMRPGLKAETAICWTEPNYGIPCRAKLDIITADHALIIDLKTTRDQRPDEFAKSVLNYGYHRQQAFYRDGCRAVYGVDPEFLFIAVSDSAPYECVVYGLDDKFDRIAQTDISIALDELNECREHNNWTGRHSELIHSLKAPAWALKFGEAA